MPRDVRVVIARVRFQIRFQIGRRAEPRARRRAGDFGVQNRGKQRQHDARLARAGRALDERDGLLLQRRGDRAELGL